MPKQQYVSKESKALYQRLRKNAIQRRLDRYAEDEELDDLFGGEDFQKNLTEIHLEEADKASRNGIGLASLGLIVALSVMFLTGDRLSPSSVITVMTVTGLTVLFGLYFTDRSVSLRNKFTKKEMWTVLIMGTSMMTSLIYSFVTLSMVALQN